jgi:hypothetical protein
MEETRVDAGFKPPAVNRVKGTRHAKQGIAKVTKWFHRRARIIRPSPTASANFKTKTMISEEKIAQLRRRSGKIIFFSIPPYPSRFQITNTQPVGLIVRAQEFHSKRAWF